MKKDIRISSYFFVSALILGSIREGYAGGHDSNQEIIAIVHERANSTSPNLAADGENLDALLKNRLTLDQALSIALHLNPDLRAKLAEGVVSAAETTQLNLVESPQIEVGTRFPVDSPGADTAIDLSVTQNLMDLIQRGSRQKMSKAEYGSKKLEVAHGILSLMSGVKRAYYDYQASLQFRTFWQSSLAAAKAAAALAKEQKNAGNISALDEAQHLSLLSMSQLEFKKSEGDVMNARLALAKWMGIPSLASSLKLPGQLPKLPSRDPDLAYVKELALANRTDLASERYKIDSRRHAVAQAEAAWLPELHVGVGAEWSAEGDRGVGPIVQMGLPFLGHRKANVERAHATLKHSEAVARALEQSIPYDLETIYQRLRLARQTIRFYEAEVFPVQDEILKESLKHYNYMLLGNYALLQSKQNQIQAKRQYIEAIHDYWSAYTDLEFLAGGSLAASPE